MGSGKSDEVIASYYFQGDIGNSPLVNKLGLTNQVELEKMEAYCVEQALKIGLSIKAKELSPNGLKQMHKEFFEAIYDWAGSYRTYTTGRGLPFCKPEYIEKELDKIYRRLNENLTNDMDKQEFVKISAWFIGELNTIHPFIDGNGRTQRQILSLIAEKAGFKVNINALDKTDWYKSAEECHAYAKYDGFEKVISSILEQNKSIDKKLLDELSTNLIKKYHPNISNDDIEKIQLYKDAVIHQYPPEIANLVLENLKEKIPDIASGKIQLPDIPKQEVKKDDIDLER